MNVSRNTVLILRCKGSTMSVGFTYRAIFLPFVVRFVRVTAVITFEDPDNVRTQEELQLRLQILADSAAVEEVIALISGVALPQDSSSTTIWFQGYYHYHYY